MYSNSKHIAVITIVYLLSVASLYQCSKEGPAPVNLVYEGELELFGEGVISTELYERDIAISPEGNEIIFTLGNHKQSVRSLVRIKKGERSWGDREILPFSGRYSDIEPFYAPDGNYLFFASDRPMDNDSSRTDYNLWKVERHPSGWGKPIPLDTLINTRGEEFYPSVSNMGNLYFTAIREDGIGSEDIFKSELKNGLYQKPVVLDSAINTSSYEFNAYIHPEENLIVFGSFGRQDGIGGGDLYYSKKDEHGNWQNAVNLGSPVNSQNLDYCPFIDVSNGVFYFTSDRAEPPAYPLNSVDALEAEAAKVLNGMGNIYRIGMDDLFLK